MDCEGIKNLMPDYIRHTASPEDTTKVEEHLCICNNCRETLAKIMDKEDILSTNEDTSGPLLEEENILEISPDPELPPPIPPAVPESSELKPDIVEEFIKEELPQKPKPARQTPLPKNADILQYFVVAVGIIIFAFLVYLLIKS